MGRISASATAPGDVTAGLEGASSCARAGNVRRNDVWKGSDVIQSQQQQGNTPRDRVGGLGDRGQGGELSVVLNPDEVLVSV